MAISPEEPVYSFYRKPRFSVNHLAEYLETRTAPQRTAVIRKAKFPKKNTVIAYQQITHDINRFFPSGEKAADYFAPTIDRMQKKARRETGHAQDEALRCARAIKEFSKTFNRRRLSGYRYDARPAKLSMPIKGVTINIRLNASIFQDVDGETYSGGLVLFMSGSDENRKNIESRRKTVAQCIHWALEMSGGNVEPLPRLCMSFDVFGNTVTRATDSFSRMRENVTESCREAARAWDDVEPPAKYDGPDWR
ncbi:hypothetical protein [Hyphococcus sp.]|uniref:hypothetical protein n=1 Tax=Hyphococcus sp. TaxID=2038636 RepID=UPI00207F8532|nr:MAG: hypothetical protein DHS20C04_31490 [Marinicaulis sp.]